VSLDLQFNNVNLSFFFLKGCKTIGTHSHTASCNFNVNHKLNQWFKCDCDIKQYKVNAGSLKTIIAHIKQCKYCVVNVDFNEFIFRRTGNSEAEIIKRTQENENNVSSCEIESSDRILRSYLH
jgi:hypothetical protein